MDGSVWLGSVDGLTKWNNGQITMYPKRGPHDVGGAVESLGQDDQGRIWVSTVGGIAYLENGQLTPVSGVPGGPSYSVAGDRAGNLWISNQDDGLFHLLNGSVVEQIPWAKLGRQGVASALVPDPTRGGVWLGFFQGGAAYFMDGQVRASYASAEGLGEGRVNDLQLDQDGVLWVATEGGLSRVKNGRVATLTSRNGLPCDTVLWARDDDAHSLWLYMACGLVRIARPELDAWASDPKRMVHVAVFDGSDGVRLRSGLTGGYSPRVARTADGKLWFLTFDGVSVLDPHHLAFNTLPPPVHIEQVTADRKTYWQNLSGDASSSHPKLPPLVRDLEIDYTALSLVAQEKVLFRYLLEGVDRDWQDVGNRRQAFYTNLSPGNYRFRVTASNNSGVWNEAGDTLDFSIAPAYYQTTWFRGLCVLAFFTLLWAGYQMRVHQLQEQEKKFREAVETMPALAFVADPTGNRTFMNRGWLEYTGSSPEEASASGWVKTVHPDDLGRITARWRTSETTGEPLEYEARLRRGSDGVYRWFLIRAVPVRDKNGKVVKWCGAATDIEDRKRAEQLPSCLPMRAGSARWENWSPPSRTNSHSRYR
jgi:PAS domain S-box-containing protein